MNEIEGRLNEEKKRLDAITAPEEFEARLRGALDAKPSRKPKHRSRYLMVAAVGLLCFMFIGYNYNAFAYYGKKLFGFDEVISETLQDLNEKGMGQIVDKKTTLIDGTELTIDGIMTDANQLIMYYTLSNPQGLKDTFSDIFNPDKVTGFLTNAHGGGGTAIINDSGKEVKGTLYFDPVSPFSRKLTLHFRQGVDNREGSVTFPYDPNKAMQTQIHQSIKETIKVDKGTLTFKTIKATPTSTVIEGKMDVVDYDRLHFGLEGVELIANGRSIQKLGYGVKSSFNGSKFDLRFDGLPAQLDSLELTVKEFIGYKELEEQIPLTSDEEIHFDLEGNDLWIKEVAATEKGIEVTFETDENVLLDGVSIESGSRSTPLKTTIGHNLEKQGDGRIISERTMIFETKTMPDHLLVEGIYYVKQYNEQIEIPVH